MIAGVGAEHSVSIRAIHTARTAQCSNHSVDEGATSTTEHAS